MLPSYFVVVFVPEAAERGEPLCLVQLALRVEGAREHADHCHLEAGLAHLVQTIEGESEQRLGGGRVGSHLLDDRRLLRHDLHAERQPQFLELSAASGDAFVAAFSVALHGFEHTAFDGGHHAHFARNTVAVRDRRAPL
jgi:hypothetical protein